MKNITYKIVLTVVLILSSKIYSQDYFYGTNSESVAVVGSESYLTFDKPTPVFSDSKSIGVGDFLSNNLTTFISLGYKIIQNQIEKDQMKYTDSFSVRRTYLFDDGIKGFRINRQIVLKNSKKGKPLLQRILKQKNYLVTVWFFNLMI